MNPEKVGAVTQYIIKQMRVDDYTTAARVADWIKGLNRYLPRSERIEIIDGRSVAHEMGSAKCLRPDVILLQPLLVTDFRIERIDDAYIRTFTPEDHPEKCNGCSLVNECYYWQEDKETENPQIEQRRISLGQALLRRLASFFHIK